MTLFYYLLDPELYGVRQFECTTLSIVLIAVFFCFICKGIQIANGLSLVQGNVLG